MSKHVCLVPNEWSKYYSQDVLEVILKKDMSCDSISKKVEGAKINVNGTTAQLRYHGEQPWMRKDQDKRTFPNPREYFGVYMSCNDCRKPPPRRNPVKPAQLAPRNRGSSKSLENVPASTYQEKKSQSRRKSI
ncbi:conserved hypothetical protein [Cotesia vestalis bracovirus]|nr:conserved hypothetical protein [Cotesia vestalis bracovirus]